MTAADPTDFTLTWGSDRRTAARQLRARVNPTVNRVTVGDLLNATDHTATRHCPQANHGHGVLHNINSTGGSQHHITVAQWYCLNNTDASTPAWTPQGVSGTEDAYQRGTVNGRRAILVSWHSGPVGGQGTGTRLTFLLPSNASPTTQVRHVGYVNVLLVRPTTDGTSYTNVNAHAGGVVWYHNYIFVPNGPRGVYIYDLRYLLDLAISPLGPIGHHPHWIGLHANGHYYGRGYRFLLPEIGRWHNSSPTTLYDYISLDRARDPLSTRVPEFLTGEYREASVGRVVRWRASAIASFPPVNGHKTIHPFRAWFQPDPYVQGGFSHSCYYFNIGGGGSGNHYLIIARPNATPTWRNGARGLQALYWLRSQNQLWTITERRGVSQRVLYGVVRPACP